MANQAKPAQLQSAIGDFGSNLLLGITKNTYSAIYQKNQQVLEKVAAVIKNKNVYCQFMQKNHSPFLALFCKERYSFETVTLESGIKITQKVETICKVSQRLASRLTGSHVLDAKNLYVYVPLVS